MERKLCEFGDTGDFPLTRISVLSEPWPTCPLCAEALGRASPAHYEAQMRAICGHEKCKEKLEQNGLTPLCELHWIAHGQMAGSRKLVPDMGEFVEAQAVAIRHGEEAVIQFVRTFYSLQPPSVVAATSEVGDCFAARSVDGEFIFGIVSPRPEGLAHEDGGRVSWVTTFHPVEGEVVGFVTMGPVVPIGRADFLEAQRCSWRVDYGTIERWAVAATRDARDVLRAVVEVQRPVVKFTASGADLVAEGDCAPS